MARGTAAQCVMGSAPAASAACEAPFGLVGQRPVGPEDERAEEGVTPVEVAVEGRGGHLELAGDGAQREGCRTLPGQMGLGHGEDLAGDLVLDPLPGGAWRRHAVSLAVPEREHKYLTRTLFSVMIIVLSRSLPRGGDHDHHRHPRSRQPDRQPGRRQPVRRRLVRPLPPPGLVHPQGGEPHPQPADAPGHQRVGLPHPRARGSHVGCGVPHTGQPADVRWPGSTWWRPGARPSGCAT